MALQYASDETVKDLLGYKFTARNDTFSAKKKDNSCYCTNITKTLDGEIGCLKDGVTDLTTCLGAPVLVSFPHLLHGDKDYIDGVVGMKPEKSKHETSITLEPVSGFPLQAYQRVQFNIFLRPIEGMVSLENVTKALIPLLWIEESLILDDKYVDMLKTTLFRTIKIVDIMKWVIIGVGVATVLTAMILKMHSEAPSFTANPVPFVS